MIDIIDTAAIREWTRTGHWPQGTDVDETLLALCDALDAARAVNGKMQADFDSVVSGHQFGDLLVAERLRAERAEAERDELVQRSVMGEACKSLGGCVGAYHLPTLARAERVEAAVAEVRRRCRERIADNPHEHDDPWTVWISVGDVLLALDARRLE